MEHMFENASSNYPTVSYRPIVGYHTLKLLDGLKQSYYDVEKEIEKVQKLSRPMNYKIQRRLKNLHQCKSLIKSDFDFWSELVEKWVSDFSEKDELIGDIVVAYYCDINNYVPKKGETPHGALSLQDILEEYMCEEDDRNKKTNAFQARVRQIALNQVQKQ